MSSAILIGLLLLLLPVSGGNGLLYVPGIALWLGIRAFCRLRNLAKQEAIHTTDCNTYQAARRAQMIMLGFVAMSVAISIAHFVGYKRVRHPWPAATMKQLAAANLHLLAAGFGQFSTTHWPLFAIASAMLTAASFAYLTFLSFHPRTSPISRRRASDIVACMISFVPVALGLAYGRGGLLPSFSTRHYTFMTLVPQCLCVLSPRRIVPEILPSKTMTTHPEDARLSATKPLDVTLYSRPGCHLCEEAKAAIEPLLKEFGANLHEVNINEDKIL